VNCLVTAGGTEERIDGVRSITNFATGRLGALIAEKLSEADRTGTVFYVCGKRAVRPGGGEGVPPGVRIFEVEDVDALEARVRAILSQNRIDAIVHSMAVSDYQVDRILDGEGKLIENTDKISSTERELRLILKPAKKIIGLLREDAPSALLIGFKLLNHVSEAELTEAAFALLQKNRCDCVLANDLAGISGTKHAAFLLDAQKNKTAFTTKEEIATGICRFIHSHIRAGESMR
jgi:phosphopantothenate-cysteine ligase